MTSHRCWLIVGWVACALMVIFLAQGALATWYSMSIGTPLSVTAILNPFTSPVIPMSLGLGWIFWTLTGRRVRSR